MQHYNAHYTHRDPKDIKLPEIKDCPTALVGTPKQVSWATQIRQKFFIKIEASANNVYGNIYPESFGKMRQLRRALYWETSAKFFIESRNIQNLEALADRCIAQNKKMALITE